MDNKDLILKYKELQSEIAKIEQQMIEFTIDHLVTIKPNGDKVYQNGEMIVTAYYGLLNNYGVPTYYCEPFEIIEGETELSIAIFHILNP